jgi:hypothetical protein
MTKNTSKKAAELDAILDVSASCRQVKQNAANQIFGGFYFPFCGRKSNKKIRTAQRPEKQSFGVW